MAAENPNSRLETFCDGVFAIAITLLVLDIKVPSPSKVHSITELWQALYELWPSIFAFALTFIIIFIAWNGHHNIFKMLRKNSNAFIFANAFFLLTIVILPFPAAMIGEYIRTGMAQPAIVIYSACCLLHNVAWIIFFYTAVNPDDNTKGPEYKVYLQEAFRGTRWGSLIYLTVLILSWWFPYTSLIITTCIWIFWLVRGSNYKVESEKS
jgi:uncharacterized membrane protein